MLTVEGGDAEMTQQKNSRKGSAVWPMVLSWLSSLILALLAVFVMLFTTFGNVGYMQSCVKSSGYAQSAYDDMVQDFISYGAATGFDADVMTGFMSVDQVESDMQDAVAGLYAKTLTYYTRDNIAEAVYSAMEQATADRGITLEGETKTAVETVAEAVRMEYASYTAVPLVSQLRTLVQKLQKVMVIGLVVSAVLLCAAVVSMLRISRKDARLGARCLVYALGGAAVVCLVLGVALDRGFRAPDPAGASPAVLRHLGLVPAASPSGQPGPFSRIRRKATMSNSTVQILARVLRVLLIFALLLNVLALLLVPASVMVNAENLFGGAGTFLHDLFHPEADDVTAAGVSAIFLSWVWIWGEGANALIALFLVICGICTALILLQGLRVLGTILQGAPFSTQNAVSLRRAAVCSFCIAGAALLRTIWGLWFYQSLRPLATYNALFVPIFTMFGLLCLVMSALFRQATEMKVENDLTI